MNARITAAMCAAGRTIGDPRLSPDGAAVAFVATGAGRASIVVVPAAGGPELVVSAEPTPRGARASGSGVFDWTPAGDALVFVGADGRLWHLPATGGPARLVAELPRCSAPAVSPDGSRVVFVVDDRDVAVAWLGPDGRWPARLPARADFCADPSWSPDGSLVAWHEWSVPDMAWDDSRVALAPAPGPAGEPAPAGAPAVVGIGGPAAVGQPRFSPDGSRLGFLCDAGGWTNLWSARPDGSGAAPLLEEPHEHGGPTWGSGQRSWAWSPDGSRVAFARNEGGFGRLCTAAVGAPGGPVVEVDRGVFSGLSWAGAGLAALRSGARTPDQLVVYPAAGKQTSKRRRVLARGPVAGFEAAGLVEPEPVSWSAEDRPGVGPTVHGRLYRTAVSGDPVPPLVLWVHGGPTGQNEVTFNARVAYFVERGWNVLQADPRGSTGWGRAYRQALHGEWGRLDVEDLAAGLRAAAASGWGDPGRLAVIGASSGGLAVLGLLARHPGLVAAGVDLYGVTDLFDLDETTHRFEAHYNRSLVGPLPGSAPLYRDRSPINLVDRIAAPLLVLHGSDDRVVVAGQSEALVAALRRRGATVEYHCYPGEGHGWSSPETIIDELGRIGDFLDRHVLRGRR